MIGCLNAAKRTSGVQNSCALDLNDCRSLTFPTAIFSHDCLNDEDYPPSSSPELASVLTRALSRDFEYQPRCNLFTWLHSQSYHQPHFTLAIRLCTLIQYPAF